MSSDIQPGEGFIRNKYGLWCPNCQESIDEFWPVSCDACGYPNEDRDALDDMDEADLEQWLVDRA